MFSFCFSEFNQARKTTMSPGEFFFFFKQETSTSFHPRISKGSCFVTDKHILVPSLLHISASSFTYFHQAFKWSHYASPLFSVTYVLLQWWTLILNTSRMRSAYVQVLPVRQKLKASNCSVSHRFFYSWLHVMSKWADNLYIVVCQVRSSSAMQTICLRGAAN